MSALIIPRASPPFTPSGSPPFTPSVAPQARSRGAPQSAKPPPGDHERVAAPRLRTFGPTLGVNGGTTGLKRSQPPSGVEGRLALLTALLALCACGPAADGDPFAGDIPFTPDRPTLPTSVSAEPYTGSDPLVMDAQTRYPTGLDLHRKVVLRTCGPTNGVCHNQKEYPDLHTPATFMAALGAPCNVQPGSWASVFDRCERAGDRFELEGQALPQTEIAWLELLPGETPDLEKENLRPDDATPGLHVFLRTPVPDKVKDPYSTALFIRPFVTADGTTQPLPFATYRTRWWILPDRRHLFGEVQDYQSDNAAAVAAAGVQQGDQNRNGLFGATAGKLVPLLNAGKPEESYLIARLRGVMQGEKVPGTRMPLANQPPSIPDMLGLMCFVEGLSMSPPPSISSAIDYNRCSYTADPGALNLVGQGVTWKGKILPLLQASCGGCHGGAAPSAGLDIMGTNPHARLLSASKQRGSLNLIQPGSPEKSYLWLKVSGDGSVVGLRMPLNASNQPIPMSQEDLDALQTWILAGALQDG